MKSCKSCLISGRVQGVFFRQATVDQATALGVNGWVRNLPNGDVECLLSGNSDAVESLCQWLKQGPPAAKVISVRIEDRPWQEWDSFNIKK